MGAEPYYTRMGAPGRACRRRRACSQGTGVQSGRLAWGRRLACMGPACMGLAYMGLACMGLPPGCMGLAHMIFVRSTKRCLWLLRSLAVRSGLFSGLFPSRRSATGSAPVTSLRISAGLISITERKSVSRCEQSGQWKKREKHSRTSCIETDLRSSGCTITMCLLLRNKCGNAVQTSAMQCSAPALLVSRAISVACNAVPRAPMQTPVLSRAASVYGGAESGGAESAPEEPRCLWWS